MTELLNREVKCGDIIWYKENVHIVYGETAKYFLCKLSATGIDERVPKNGRFCIINSEIKMSVRQKKIDLHYRDLCKEWLEISNDLKAHGWVDKTAKSVKDQKPFLYKFKKSLEKYSEKDINSFAFGLLFVTTHDGKKYESHFTFRKRYDDRITCQYRFNGATIRSDAKVWSKFYYNLAKIDGENILDNQDFKDCVEKFIEEQSCRPEWEHV